jgi:hypothetical protein
MFQLVRRLLTVQPFNWRFCAVDTGVRGPAGG